MTDFAIQAAIIAGMLLTFLLGPGIAMVFLLLRKRVRRARRRSPIGIDLLRGPGHSVREKLDEAINDLTWDVVLLSVMPIVFLTLFLAQGHVIGLDKISIAIPIYAFATVVFITGIVWKIVRAAGRIDHLRAGFDAELAVGQELDQLMRKGAAVFHDFPAENFNIDHVVVSTQGVFAVETKGYTKAVQLKGQSAATVVFDGQVLRFPTWSSRAAIDQAERQAQWLSKWASSAVGERIGVLPVLALPGWFVDRQGRGEVRVFSGKELSGLLQSRTSQALSEQQVQRIAHQVEQRCRTVVPTYRRDPDAK